MPSTEAQVKAAVAGRYDVDREIGRGGMATVYLARDVKHNREVALKVLNPELGAVLGVERFLSEIQVTANLQHPHLLPLYDSGESNGLLYYVMPYVEGEGSLREMLNREKQLPVDDAVRIAAAVASALAYAHKKGVIHRDLKPENILLQGGQPFVADFGIALAVSMAGGNRITQTGLSLGTPQYMSPEQATGERVIDARSDIYSLGCVLYEMLAGEPPHVGGTAQAVIARVLTEKPRPIRQLRDTVPEQLEWAIDRALAKIPADRFATAGEFHHALVGRATLARPESDARDARARARYSRRFTRSAALALFGASLALVAVVAWKGNAIRKSGAAPARFHVTLPGASMVDGFSLSRDGKSLAYISGLGASRQLVVRGLDEAEPRPLPGTSGADHPIWSPNGQWIAFTANGQIRKTPAAGGAAQVVGPFGFGYDWIDDDTMIIGSGLAGMGLRRSARPGAPLAVITRPVVDSGAMFHVYPLVLPKAKVAFVIWGVGGLEDDYIAIGDLETGRYVESRLVAITTVAFQDGWLLYHDPDRRLMAARVDLGKMTVDPTPVVLQENVVSAAVAPGASLILTGQRTTGIYKMSIGADTGLPTLVTESDGIITGVRIAPDRSRIAYVVTRGDSAQLLVHDLRTGTSVRLWTGGGVKDPEWTPDGRSILFSEGAPRLGLWRLSAHGGFAPQLIISENYPRHPAISPDGGTLVYVANVAAGANERRYDLWSASLVGAPAPRALVAERDGKSLPAISPSGRWLAYISNENTYDDVYVRSLTGAPGRWRVSLEGGMEPRWSRDGRRLFYRSGGDVFAATLRETPVGVEVVSRARVGHFTASSLSAWDSMYDVSWDNKLYVAGASESGWQLVFAQNWLEDFRQRVTRR